MSLFVFTGIVWKEGDEYSALCPEMDVVSQAETSADARKNLLEAAGLHIEGCFEDGLPYFRPVAASDDPRNSIPSEQLEIFKFKVDVAVKAYA